MGPSTSYFDLSCYHIPSPLKVSPILQISFKFKLIIASSIILKLSIIESTGHIKLPSYVIFKLDSPPFPEQIAKN